MQVVTKTLLSRVVLADPATARRISVHRPRAVERDHDIWRERSAAGKEIEIGLSRDDRRSGEDRGHGDDQHGGQDFLDLILDDLEKELGYRQEQKVSIGF